MNPVKTNPATPGRLLLVISCYSSANTGRGGHYYTVRDLARAFSAAWPASSVHILVVGNIFPAPLDCDDLTVEYVDFTGKSPWAFVRDVLRVGARVAPTHVHSFDNKSHFFGRWIARRAGAQTYLTKPGGPNPRHFFPFAPDIVCFSSENLDNLRVRRNLARSNFHFLPQRVAAPTQDLTRTVVLRVRTGDARVLLRICRIGGFYRQSLEQTLRLAEALRGHGLKVCALIIGTVEDQAVLDHITAIAGAHDVIVTDPHFTTNASQLISVADAVVGTGRGLVEAAACNKVLLTPLAGAELPILVTEQNWKQLAATNFSERNRVDGAAPPLDHIARAITCADHSAAAAVSADMSLDAAVPQYRAMYCAPQPRRRQVLDFVLNSAPVLVPYVTSRRARA